MRELAAAVVVVIGCNGGESPPPPKPTTAPPPATKPQPKVQIAAPATKLVCFEAAQQIPIPGGPISDVDVADFDRDGMTDVVISHDGMRFSRADFISILHNEQGKLERVEDWQADESTLGVRAVDLDLDGLPDVVTTAVIFDGTARSSFHTYKNQGSNHFESDSQQDIGRNCGAHYMANVIGDDKPEILVTTPNSADVYTGLAPIKRLAKARAGRFPEVVRAADVDGDGDQDLVTINNDSYDLMVHENVRGKFGAPRKIETCVSPVGLEVIDLDHDGKLDAVVSCAGMRTLDQGDLAPAMLGVVWNLAGPLGKLEGLTKLRVQEFVLADWTGDGNADAFTIDVIDARVSQINLLRSGARGEMIGVGSELVGGHVNAPRLIDLDHDGAIDVVARMWDGRAAFLVWWRAIKNCQLPTKTI